MPFLVQGSWSEKIEEARERYRKVVDAFPSDPEILEDEDLSIVKELFGQDFLTNKYYLRDLITIDT